MKRINEKELEKVTGSRGFPAPKTIPHESVPSKVDPRDSCYGKNRGMYFV